jgi:hypothetical protein
MYPLNVGGWRWDYPLPAKIRARCGRTSLTVRPRSGRWPLFRALSGGFVASSALAGGNGWLEHRMPIAPNT